MARRFGRFLAALLLLAVLGALFAPWQQSVTGSGSVVAFAPLERLIQRWHDHAEFRFANHLGFISMSNPSEPNRESYTPGHTQNSTSFMTQRSLASHGQFFIPHITEHDCILDVGCGPGSISVGLAKHAPKGQVCGVDFGESQIEAAKRLARDEGLQNLEFQVASCYELPFDDNSFDRVFSHALMEHLSDPVHALQEYMRVLKPDGLVGVCSPDFDGTLLAPTSVEVAAAIEAYVTLQQSNGGDLRVGHKLGGFLSDAGFTSVSMNARYECYESREFIGEYLAKQLDLAEMPSHAACLREWSTEPVGMFSQCWVSAVGSKPSP